MSGLVPLPEQHKGFSSGLPFLSQTTSFEGGHCKMYWPGFRISNHVTFLSGVSCISLSHPGHPGSVVEKSLWACVG